jgi:hypothetical protein
MGWQEMTQDKLIELLAQPAHTMDAHQARNVYLLALQKVVEMHKPYENTDMGMCCRFCVDNKAKEYWYPCPTIQAIEKELK